MKARNLMLTLALCFAGATVLLAQSAQMGTWKLNEAKSQIPAGAPKNTTVVYEAAGDSVKVTADGTDRDGKSQHTEWTRKFDGKSYPLTGDPNADSRMYKQIDDRTLTIANMKDGKAVSNGRVTVSADGKSRTVHMTGTDSAGKKITSVAVYDKHPSSPFKH